MKRATLAVLAFVATTVVSTTTVSAINTHAYSGAYCKARYGSEVSYFSTELGRVWNTSWETRYIACPILMDQAVSNTGNGAKIYVYVAPAPANADDRTICEVNTLLDNGVPADGSTQARLGSGWLPTLIITQDAATYNMVCRLPPRAGISAIQVDEND
jgi:hypothetical protein